MSDYKLLVECPAKDSMEVENICVEKGISISEYFLSLHRKNMEPTGEEETETLDEYEGKTDAENYIGITLKKRVNTKKRG
jgi:hypothetical protein